MSKCTDFMEHLSAYVDGELSGAEKRQMEAHLISCNNCSGLLRLYRGISKVNDDSTVLAPKALINNVMERVHSDGARFENKSKRYKRNRTFLTKYAPVAACLLVALLALPVVLPILFNRNDSAPASAPDAAVMPAEAPAEDVLDEAFTDMAVAEVAPAPATFGAELFPEDELSDIEPSMDGRGLFNYDFDVFGFRVADSDGNYIYLFGEEGILHYTSAPYFTVISIMGELPEVLTQYEPYELEYDADFNVYMISPETALNLIDEMANHIDFMFTDIYETGEYAIVIHQPISD